MYDELVKRLRYCSEENGCGMCALSSDCVLRVGLLTQAADAIEKLWKKYLASEVDATNLTGWLAEEHAKHLWIPVTEALPERFVPVIVYGNGVVGCGDFTGLAGPTRCPSWDCDTSEIEQVTHWMPLPEPPKETI